MDEFGQVAVNAVAVLVGLQQDGLWYQGATLVELPRCLELREPSVHAVGQPTHLVHDARLAGCQRSAATP
jgi:hypothetical protein